MKKLAFVLAGASMMTLGACSGSNQDVVNNAELNQPGADLNEQANAAAMNAAEDTALGNQQQQLDQNAAADNAANPTDEDEQNVSGM
jgi:E3 ubiquitin-protein ligase DOA10